MTSWIYFIQHGTDGPIKIGTTSIDPKDRLDTLQISAPEKLSLLMAIHGDASAERDLHSRFSDSRIRRNGEWFRPTKDLLDFIAGAGANYRPPDVRGKCKPNRKRPLTVPELVSMCEVLPSGIAGDRDRAILLLGFAGAFRRSALVALDVTDIELLDGVGLRVTIRKDQKNDGRTIVVPYGSRDATCPVRAALIWIKMLARSTGPLFVRFRSGRRAADPERPIMPPRLTQGRLGPPEVAKIVRACARAAGIDPADLAGHSLRSGLATAAAKGGKRLDRIMAQTGHVKAETVLGYIRDEEAGDEENAARGIGL